MPAIIAIGLRDKPRQKGSGDRSNLEHYPFPSMKPSSMKPMGGEAPSAPPEEEGAEPRLEPPSPDPIPSRGGGGAMFSKAQTGYSGAADTCASCSHFLPPTGCKYVAGGVEEGGRCNLHSNMTGGESAMEEEGETPEMPPPPPEPMEEEEEA